MTAISESIEINRSPDDVFAYLDDVERHGSGKTRSSPSSVKARAVARGLTRPRNAPRARRGPVDDLRGHRAQSATAIGVPRPRWAGTRRGNDLDRAGRRDGTRSKLTIAIDFKGHGLAGKVLLPVARARPASRSRSDQAKLKELLESGAA